MDSTRRVVIIGAGPAGAAAAMSLTRFSDLEVLLLDRATFPRQKVCGSGLSPWALDLLDKMELGALVRREAFAIGAGRIAGARGDGVELRSSYHAAVLLRERFDALLVEEAVQRGARLQEGTRVDEVQRCNGRVAGVRTSQGNVEAYPRSAVAGLAENGASADWPFGTTHSR